MRASGERVSGAEVIRAITNMHERSNGLGGGFAAYGIYPEHKEDYALHLMYSTPRSKDITDKLLEESFQIKGDGPIPTRPADGIVNAPILWRYFVRAKPEKLAETEVPEDEAVLRVVMDINFEIEDAFVISSGKNMGAFKAVGLAGDVGHFYRLEDYYGYTWIAHARFPTNTPGWWGGAHPFTLLDWAVVHNGEISSYGINRRYLEMFGYKCTLQTDTEVMAYLLDLLIRKHGLSVENAAMAMASPFWKDIDALPPEERHKMMAIRAVYGSAMVNGPFAIIFGHHRGMVGLNDRIKLRPMVAAQKDDALYIASEEAGIREVCSHPDRVWSPRAGEPVVGWLNEGVA
ncbi:MAG: glutamine amidotransferase family protein [Chloroflexi bacterium]|nr:glutamine amidotransferase family protein [Chloroflexota bacterium]